MISYIMYVCKSNQLKHEEVSFETAVQNWLLDHDLVLVIIVKTKFKNFIQ